MKKIMCESCGAKRGRRKCIRTGQNICADCCTRMQLDSACPEICPNIGKLSGRELREKTEALIESGIAMIDKKPDASISIFDRVLQLDPENFQSLIGKGTAYESMGQLDRSIECLEKAYGINPSDSVKIKLAYVNMKAGHFKKSISLLSEMCDHDGDCNAHVLYMLGNCYYLDGDYKNASTAMEKLLSNPGNDILYRKRAAVLLSKSYMGLKDFESAVRCASDIDDEFADERSEILESAYFMSGRMYELLLLIDSLPRIGIRDEFMLLQCCRALKKDSRGDMLGIVGHILKGGGAGLDFVTETGLLGFKIVLLFKELRLREAYECYIDNEKRIIDASSSNFDCHEASCLIAFFLYGVDRANANSIYRAVTGFDGEALIIDGLFDAFSAMDISPYVKAKAIERSIEMLKSGGGDDFNRTAIVADILFEQRDYADALSYYRRLKDTRSFCEKGMYNMAVCLIKQSAYQEASDVLTSMISADGDAAQAYPQMIKCCLELDRDPSEYLKMLRLEHLSFADIYGLAGDMLEHQHYDKAGYLYSYLLSNYNSMDIYSRKMVSHDMACVYRGLNDFQRGIDDIRSLPEKYISDDLKIDMGCLYYDSGDKKSALELFGVIDDSRFGHIVNFNAGIIRMSEHDYQEALECFDRSASSLTYLVRNNSLSGSLEHMDMANRLCRNRSLCLAGLGKIRDSLVYAEDAVNIRGDAGSDRILSSVQEHMLRSENDCEDEMDIDSLMDTCMMAERGFADEITRRLDNIMERIYGKPAGQGMERVPEDDKCAGFIVCERDRYIKDRNSIEHSGETFRRFMDGLCGNFDSLVLPAYGGGNISDMSSRPQDADAAADALLQIGDRLLEEFAYRYPEEYAYSSLLPYYQAVKLCARYRLYPYYNRRKADIPAPERPDDFKSIGVYCYGMDSRTFYRIDLSFDVSCSKYLVEINCHPGLRSMYINPYQHYMPWDKLLRVISSIKRRWTIEDDTKAGGLLLLFYCAYKNYLGVEGLRGREEIIKLASDMIQFSNEAEYCIRSMLEGGVGYDCAGKAREVKDIAVRCITGLRKINELG